ncbi:MAG: hypothetical protein ACI4EX_10500 [Lachnospiraceae bacterium]
MTTAKRVLVFTLALAIALSIAILPAAASSYILRCTSCGSRDLSFIAEIRYPLGTDDNGNDIYYIENWYRCNQCGADNYVDASLLN